MEENKTNNRESKSTENSNSGAAPHGTKPVSSNQQTPDISQIDQQEGDMNNGTLGGNMGDTTSNTTHERQ